MRRKFTLVLHAMLIIAFVHFPHTNLYAQGPPPGTDSATYYANVKAHKNRADDPFAGFLTVNNDSQSQSKYPKVMAWWGGFNSIKMTLDSVPDGVDQIHVFFFELDARPNVALDTTHLIMQGFSMDTIVAQAHRLQARGIKVIATIMGQRGTGAKVGKYGIPPNAYPKAFAFGAITTPDTFAATIKRRVIDQWGFDGIDLDVEDGYGGEAAAYNVTLNSDSTSYTVSSASAANTSNAANFFAALGKYFGPKSGTGKLFIIDRGPNPNYIVPATYQYFDQIIMQAYNWYDSSRITKAYNTNKPYFTADQMFFTLTASRAPDGWDENPKVISNGFYFQGSQKTTSQAATIAATYAKIKLPGQTTSINTGEYQISGDWSLGFPMLKGMISVSTELPVTGMNLQAKIYTEQVQLTWSTFTETSNKGFEVQRSGDGTTFVSLGFINTKALNGCSNFPLQYSFIDNAPVSGINYYRLKQTDIGGGFKYSNTVSVSNSSSINVYPNPVDDNLHVTGIAANTSFRIVNMNGQTVKATNSTIISVKDLTPGIYFLQIMKNGKLMATAKFSKK